MRSKLAAVLVVPAVAFLVLASLNMAGQIQSAGDFDDGATVAEFGRQVTSVVHELQAERDLTAGFIAQDRPDPVDVSEKRIAEINAHNNKVDANGNKPTAIPIPKPNSANLLAAQRKNLDAALASYREAEQDLGDGLGDVIADRVERARADIDALAQLRRSVDNVLLTSGAIAGQYNGMVATLLQINREIGERGSSRELGQRVDTLNFLSNLKELTSQERALLYAIAYSGGYGFGEFQQLSSAIARESAAVDRFRQEATGEQRALYDELVNGQAILAVRRIQDSAINRQQAQDLGIDPQQWYQASTTKIELIRAVESRLLDSVVDQAQSLRADAQRQALTTALVIATILLIAFLTSLLIARSMIRPLRRLRTSALDVAQNRLPQAIERLRSPDGATADVAIEPIGVNSRDEIGEVAATFDEIHREAVRLATEQAALRSNVNAMFVNLSRRSQGLVERQLKLIDELETGEQDPDQLSNLFKLDHLATRMRRNSENLLVLAGEDAGRRWGRPIPLVDVLRAATSEVEQYHRVQLTGVPDVEVMGHAVNHVVHLVAELLENATVFSSPESKVLVHSQRLSDGGAMIEIEDRGIGMTAQEISDANERLARPPVFDVSISRMMGLYVVGRLAGRHGITVRLRQSELGGVSAFVRVPADMLSGRGDHPLARPGAGEPGPSMAPPPAPAGAPAGAAPAAAHAGGPPPGGGAWPGPAMDLPRRPLSGPGGAPLGPGGPVGPPGPGGPPPGFGAPAMPGAGMPGGHPSGAQPGQPGPGGPPRPGLPTGPDSMPNMPAPLPRRTPAGSGNGGNPGGPHPNGPVPAQPAPGSPNGPMAVPPPPLRPAPVSQNGGPDDGRPPAHPQPVGGGAPARPNPLQAGNGIGAPVATNGRREERTPIFEQLQSEWFRRRPGVGRGTPGARPVPAPAAPERTAPPVEAPAMPERVPAAAVPVAAVPAGPAEPGADEPWESPADEGWRAAERLLSPTTGGTTRAGLPVRVPQAHLVPGAAESPPPPPPPPGPPAYRSPEAVRSRLASYHQGVRRGRHADRRGETAERDPSDVLVQSQEKS